MTEEESIFNYWNWLGIIVHTKRSTTFDKIKKARKKKSDYSIDEIIEAMDRYKEVLTKDIYFWNYKWTLFDFLSRSNSEVFYGENFVRENYLKDRSNSIDQVQDKINNNPFREDK